MPVLAVTGYDVVVAIHIMAVVIAFGWTFTLPVVYAIAARQDPHSLPTLHRIEFATLRYVTNPALVIVFGAGIFLASDGHHWSEFFVQWGLAVVVVLGGLLGAVLMPAAKRAQVAVGGDLESWNGEGQFEPGAGYRAIVQRLNVIGSLASGLVLVTILFMTIKP